MSCKIDAAKILLIDGDALIRRSIACVLLAKGYAVLTAEDGMHGMELLHREKPALVVVDICMPGQEGIETILAIRREDSGVKIIAVSGGGRAGNTDPLAMARRLGADAIIEKPFRSDQLLDRIAALMPGVATVR